MLPSRRIRPAGSAGSDAYRLVHEALAARLADVEAQRDLAPSTDVDGWLPATP